MLRTILVALLLACAPALAEEGKGTIEFENGTVSYSLDRTTAEVTFSLKDRKVIVPGFYDPSEHGRWGDSALIFLSEGGSACPGHYVWLTVDDKGLKTSEVFGTCADLTDLEIAEGKATVSMPRMDGSGYTGFEFDGLIVTEVEQGLKSAGIDDPLDAASWDGRPLYDMLTAAEMEPILLDIMDWQELEEVRASGTIYSEGFVEQDGWYVATACRAHACNVDSAGAAISTADGSVVVARWSEEGGGVLHGTPNAHLPNAIRSLLRQGY